jgi:hypothetical protein
VARDHLRRVLVHARIGQQQRLRREFGNPVQIVKANPWLLLLASACGRRPRRHGSMQAGLGWQRPLPLGMLVLAVVWVMGNSVNHVFFASPMVAWLLAATLPAGHLAWSSRGSSAWWRWSSSGVSSESDGKPVVAGLA